LERLPEHVEGLFCSELCMQTCDTVRYWRRVTRDGRYERSDVRQAVWTRVAFLLAGGYGKAARRLSPETRERVWGRDGGACRRCGQPGEEIDHIQRDSPDMDNLQLLCKVCHHVKTNERMRPADDGQKKVVADLIAKRVKPDVPALLADDEVRWKTQWSGLKKARRERLFDAMREMDLDPADFRGASRPEMVIALNEATEDENDARSEADAEYPEEYGDYFDLIGDDDSGYGPNSYFAHAMAKDD
jgi:hypothetical protein